jgi:hypothetical protein
MKRIIFVSVLVLTIASSVSFAGTQSDVKETRNVSGFTKVSFGVAGNLYINLGSEFKVVIEGEKRYVDEVITEVQGGKLVIKTDNWRIRNWRGNEKVDVYITMPEISGLGVSGSGKAEVKDLIKTGNLNLSVSGSGRIYISDMNVAELGCSISGSGDISLGSEGTAGKADISISGSGNFNGGDVKIATAEIHISGSGNCVCNVTDSLRAGVSGSGNITYSGNPKVDAHVSGSGKVRSR